jgi:hypothetical protein
MIRTPTSETTTELVRELEILEHRLQDGERRIEEATHIGAETIAWEEFWIELLHTYEAVYRRLADLDPGIARPIAA